jgi:subtilisin-like proprotein convertase family protein
MKFQSFARMFRKRWLRGVPSARPDRLANRPSVESLEDRTLLDVTPILPAAQVINRIPISAAGGNLSSPSIAIDPLHPNRMVAAYLRSDPNSSIVPLDSVILHPYTIRVDCAFSNDGGATWTVLPEIPSASQQSAGFYFPINVIDFVKTNLTPAGIDAWHFLQSTQPSVAFDRNDNFFVVYTESSLDNVEGDVMMQKYSFTAAQPKITDQDHFLYRWGLKDWALNPQVVVDTNLPSYADPTSGKIQTDVNSGNVYVTWNTNNTSPKLIPIGTAFNPNMIMMTASSDDGATWSGIEPINQGLVPPDPFGFTFLGDQNYAALDRPQTDSFPQIAVSQGNVSGTVPGGQVNMVWNNFAPIGGNPPSKGQIVTAAIDNQVQGYQSPAGSTGVINWGAGSNPVAPGITTFTTKVNLPANFTVSDVQVTMEALIPSLPDYTVLLVAPYQSFAPDTSVHLLNAHIDVFGKNITGIGVTGGDNLGIVQDNLPDAPVESTSIGTQVGTIFDDNAPMEIQDQSMTAHFAGLVAPESTVEGGPILSDYNGQTGATLSGTWKLIVIDNAANAPTGTTPVPFMYGWHISFTSGGHTNAQLQGRHDTVAAGGLQLAGAMSNAYPLKIAADPNTGIGPSPTIASDNTLGGFSPYQGRLYITYTDGVTGPQPPNPTLGVHGDNTDIILLTSDNGGASWTNQGRVNTDNAVNDGSSENNDNGAAGVITGRPQFQSQVEVDQATGTVVVSFFDTRDDAARARVATYIATSIDGGLTFSPETFVNAPNAPTDAVTGQAVTVGPIPDNQSAANPNAEATFAFGTHQALAVFDGKVYAAWSGNQNGGSDAKETLRILSAEATIAAGPRILASTMGPPSAQSVEILDNSVLGNAGTSVLFNNQFSSTGVQELNGFVVTFDRFVDPVSFTTSDVNIFYRDPNTPGSTPGAPIPATSVTPLFDPDLAALDPRFNFASQQALGAMRFLVSFAPQSAVGTYSYTVGPNINDRIQRALNIPITPAPSSSTPSTATSTATVVGTAGDPLYNIVVNATITDQLDSPLTLTLISPTGQSVVLASGNGGNGANFIGTTFDDGAATPISSGTAPFTGSFQPIQPLANFDGIDADGTWTLRIDNNSTTDSGLLLTWSAQITLTSGKVVPLNPSPGNFMDQNGNGVAGQNPTVANPITAFTPGDVYAAPQPQPLVPETFGGNNGRDPHDFEPPYNTNTLPLQIAGPHIVSTMANSTFTPAQSELGLSIPATAGGSANSTLTISGEDPSITVVHLTVNVSLTDVNDAGLVLTLIGPDGTTAAILSNKEGGGGQNFTNTTFDDAANTAISAGSAPFSGTFTPDQPLSVFIGMPLNGTWTLQVTDSSGGDAGQIVNWSMTATVSGANPSLTLNGTTSSLDVVFDRNMLPASFTPAQILQMVGPIGPIGGPFTVTPNPFKTDPDPAHPRTFAIGFPTQVVSGTYVVTFGPGIADETGALIDTNLNAGIDMLRETASAGTQAQLYTDSTPTSIGGAAAGIVTNATLTINDDFLIQGITLKLNISYGNDPDLSAVLIAPDGVTTVPLFTNVGNTGTRANFTNTVFDDAATTPIDLGGPPFLGSFNPEQSLLTALKGTSSKGTWTLQITDNAARSGTLNSWSLTLLKPVPLNGLGEPVADQASANFRIFTMDPANPLSHAAWTPVGPAAIGTNGNSGNVSAIAVDPSDPSGNIVYIGAATGGVWKTTNFLTTNPGGPTWVPLTDFTPALSINIASITIFPRNNDPRQSIIFAATGNGNTFTAGVGVLISMDGGASWSLSSGPVLNGQTSPAFIGSVPEKIIVDPRPTVTGNTIIYMALSGAGKNGGIWRSLDTGKTWTLMRSGNATDVLLDPASGTINAISNPTGNLQVVYSGFAGEGVFISPNQAQTWDVMLGGVGDPLIRDADFGVVRSIAVNGPASTPTTVASGKILLAKPALVGNPLEDTLYEGWLYALVVTPAGNFAGLYMTKDFGQNWTNIPLNSQTPFLGGQRAIPSNDSTLPQYNIFNNPVTSLPSQGIYDVSFAIDPNNPNVVYIGGSGDILTPGVVRVDTTGVSDAHSLYLGNDRNTNGDAGNLRIRSADPVGSKGTFNTFFLNPLTTPYLNLIRNPADPFNDNATIFVSGANNFANTGAGISWVPFDQTLVGSGGQHAMLTMRDPLTGQVRMIFGDNQGVFTGLDNNGVYENSVGSVNNPFDQGGDVLLANGSRNGNLQITEFYYGASQPSNLAAAMATLNGLFYGGSQENGSPYSDPNVLSNGNIVWTPDTAISPYAPESDFNTAGVATDQTGSGTFYQYNQPSAGGGAAGTDFFQVNTIGRTFGLLQASNNGFPTDPQWPYDPAGAQAVPTVAAGGFANFAVNPIDNQQMIISSSVGRIFGTSDQGVIWLPIGDPTALDGSYAPALAYGAPDPADPSGQLNDFLYAGTVNGNIFVTFTGGGAQGNQWIKLSAGLDGSAVREIVTNPTRGSHEAYAVTDNGVYHMVDASAKNATWQKLAGVPGSLDTIQADWRYAIPDNPVEVDNPIIPPGSTHPVLYVGGTAGVYRSVDGGNSWTIFPDVVDDGAKADGGYLPTSNVTDLTLALGNIDPTTGRPVLNNLATGAQGPDILLATTYGRGDFAIRVAPVLVPNGIQLDPARPAPNGSISGPDKNSTTTNVLQPVFDGMSELSAFGNTVTIRLYDLTNGTVNPPEVGFDSASGNPFVTTDENGRFFIQVIPGYFKSDGSTDGAKLFGFQATDADGAIGPMETFSWTLNTTPFVVDIPGDPRDAHLDASNPLPPAQGGSDSGQSFTDKITNVAQPIIDGVVEQAAPLQVQLLENGQVIGSGMTDANGNFSIQVNPGVYGPGGMFPDGLQTIDIVAPHIPTNSNTAVFTFTVVTVPPPVPPAPTLVPSSQTGFGNAGNITNQPQPTFSGTGQVSPFGPTLVLLYANGQLVGTDTLNGLGQYDVTVGPSSLVDGVYNMTVQLEDVAGNFSPMSNPMQPALIVNTKPPTTPTIFLDPGYNTGPAGAVPPETAAVPQQFDGTSDPNTQVQILDSGVVIDTFNMGSARTFSRLENLSDGDHLLTVTAENNAGNTATFAPPQPDGKFGYEIIVNPTALDKDLLFVRALYYQDLGRQGSLPEWQSWLPVLAQNNGRFIVTNAIERSAEAQHHMIIGWYQTYLGRGLGLGEDQGWVNMLLAGATQEQVLADILGSAEYFNHAPNIPGVGGGPATNTTFVKALYLQLLNRQPGSQELANWLTILPQVGNAGVAAAILGSAEYRGNAVVGYYLNVLKRPQPPSPGEINSWVVSGIDLTTMLIDFESTVEYFFRVTGFLP